MKIYILMPNVIHNVKNILMSNVSKLIEKYYHQVRVDITPDISDILNFAKSLNNIEHSIYFTKLSDAPLDNFYASQSSFAFAIDRWSGIFGMLVNKITAPKERFTLIKNLYDENEGIGHVGTFELLMKIIQTKCKKESCSENTFEATEKFINSLVNMINTKDKNFCFGCLGMIEYTYVDVSRLIRNYLLKYIEPDEIVHYTVHETLDVTHAEELFKLINFNRISMNGMIYGYNLMHELYSSMALELFCD